MMMMTILMMMKLKLISTEVYDDDNDAKLEFQRRTWQHESKTTHATIIVTTVFKLLLLADICGQFALLRYAPDCEANKLPIKDASRNKE